MHQTKEKEKERHTTNNRIFYKKWTRLFTTVYLSCFAAFFLAWLVVLHIFLLLPSLSGSVSGTISSHHWDLSLLKGNKKLQLASWDTDLIQLVLTRTRDPDGRYFSKSKRDLWTAYQYPCTVVEIVFSRIWIRTVEMSNDILFRRKAGGPTMSGYRLLHVTGTDLIAKDILSVTIKAVIGTRPGPRLSTVFAKIRRLPEVPVRHKRTQIRTEISQQPPPLPLPLTTWNKGSFIVA